MTDHKDNSRILEDFKASYQLKYGLNLDDWSATNLMESQRQFDKMKLRLDVNLQQNKMLYDRFKGSIKTIQFKSSTDAFLYGLGRSLPFGLPTLVLILLGFQWLSSTDKYQQVGDVLSRYENVEAFENLIIQGKLKTENGVQYLILQPGDNKGGNVYGQHYWYDPRKKIVKIPLRAQQ